MVEQTLVITLDRFGHLPDGFFEIGHFVKKEQPFGCSFKRLKRDHL